MTANLILDTHMFRVEGPRSTITDCGSPGEICSSIRKWTSIHVQIGLQPKQIEALIDGKNATEIGCAHEALYTAGGKLLDEKTFRTIAASWRWPIAKFGMRQSSFFRGLHSQHDTLPFTIQEPDFLHYRECEAASEARTPKELHRLYDHKDLHLREPDARFDAASRLTKDPVSVGQQHWGRVLRLFRDRSYDALVRYFAAYMQAENSVESILS